MIILIKESTPRARKNHKCMAMEAVMDAVNDGIFNFSEYRDIVEMKKRGWEIQIGETYVTQCCVDEKHVYDFKASIKMHKLCLKYDLYED